MPERRSLDGKSLSIVLPMWNEEGFVHIALGAAREACEHLIEQGRLNDYELVIVDDASTDLTPTLVRDLAESDMHVRLVSHAGNRGLGGALKTGFAEARGELLLYTDADLPCDLREALSRAFRLMDYYGADVVSAYRHDRTAEGPRRGVYSYGYNLLVRGLFAVRVRDVNFAFKLFRREVLDQIRLRSEGSFIDAEFLIRAHRHGFHVIQFGVDYFPRRRGVSTLSSRATIAGILRELVTMKGDLDRIEPLRPNAPNPVGSTLSTAQRRSPVRDSSMTRGRLLIVSADDYGLTEGISRGILRAHREGLVTSVSVLAVGPAFNSAAPRLTETPGLGVGVHLAAVGEDPPLLTAREIPSIVDRVGRLAPSWGVFLRRSLRGEIDQDDLRREFRAQIARVRDLGIQITHLDTHQHLHLWPPVREVVLDLCSEFRIAAVRVPRSSTLLPGIGVNFLGRRLASRAQQERLKFPQRAAGLDEAGAMDARRFEAVIVRLASTGAPTAEVVTHPGDPDDGDGERYRWGYRWADELEALMGVAAKSAVRSSGFELGTYADLVHW